jgi:hypothetical protein
MALTLSTGPKIKWEHNFIWFYFSLTPWKKKT